MPEGPSILILKEEVSPFTRKEVIEVSGNSNIGIERIKGQTILEFNSFGKQFLICFKDFTIRIHFLLFGTYRINERKENPPRLSLMFEDGEINFYGCSIKHIDEPLNEVYDWSADVLSAYWDEKAAMKKLKKTPNTLVCDALLDQEVFAGVGNIIKNEVLYRINVHPESKVGALPNKNLKALVFEARNYSFDFLNWKKQYILKKNWLAHTKKICKRCDLPLIKKHLGKTNRRSFFCENCQMLYS